MLARRTVEQLPAFEQDSAFATLQHLERALVNLQWACGISSELEFIPETRELVGLHELHDLSLVPMSYHIVTAIGALRMILTSGPRRTLLSLMISCIVNTLNAGEHIAPNIEKMRLNVPPDYSRSVEAADTWLNACLREVQNAFNIAKAFAGTSSSELF